MSPPVRQRAEALQQPVIRMAGLTKTYEGVQALRSLDREVKQNSILGFLGPNGAGKATAIKLLLGLTRPSAGSATAPLRRSEGGCPRAPRKLEADDE